MISYNPKDWFTFIFRFHKADTFRTLFPLMLGLGAYSFGVAYIETEVLQLNKSSRLLNITTMHGMLGFVISLLLVFRTNTAYDRWWEGRKMWGLLVNNSRNLAIKLSVMLTEESDRAKFRSLIPHFAFVLHRHLGNPDTASALNEDGIRLQPGKHAPNQVAMTLFGEINQLYKDGKITGDQLIILNSEVRSFTDICGACERIKNTPIPYSYSAFIKKFIFFYVMTLPLGWVFQLGYYVIPAVMFILYVLASLELIAEEIEDPFGSDANDLPTRQMATNIRKHVEEVL